MSAHTSVPSFGAALHALSALTGQPEHFFLGRPADSARTRGARVEFVAMLLLDLDDHDALTARRRTTPRPALLTLVDELELAENAAAGLGLDDEITEGWAA
ncbi:hypothetical protein K388_07353 [Streptomyces sp. KhCrAH-43]|uniref:hypothetical protein n=1 Tax=unclassified Streptomyces TaxID=2593676 RepID=UPI00036A008C|nr:MULTISPECIES: hypothetical protein [unclassified Streptomyces]MYS37584.1 hypothetical protein [Streptomyces sp. SID4920]MYX67190.1 hypothetical protein [Streptomyces sp. SID8373]RAJ44941.1 hypothetical protein K388_07353 [Streptomyces sp. KhCrAH-43]